MMYTSPTDNRTQCECEDGACDAEHHSTARGRCEQPATVTLYRIDMHDDDGTRFCDECADDAHAAGVFASERNAHTA